MSLMELSELASRYHADLIVVGLLTLACFSFVLIGDKNAN